jgi:hypothetical protein
MALSWGRSASQCCLFVNRRQRGEQLQTQLQAQINSGLRMHLSSTGYLVGHHSGLSTDFRSVIAAAIVELVYIAFVAPTYFSWWPLRRAVSFSPLEIAKIRRSWYYALCKY